MNKDQVKGRLKEAEGTVGEVAGRIVGNRTMQAKGVVKKNLGKLRKGIGDARQSLKVAIDEA